MRSAVAVRGLALAALNACSASFNSSMFACVTCSVARSVFFVLAAAKTLAARFDKASASSLFSVDALTLVSASRSLSLAVWPSTDSASHIKEQNIFERIARPFFVLRRAGRRLLLLCRCIDCREVVIELRDGGHERRGAVPDRIVICEIGADRLEHVHAIRLIVVHFEFFLWVS